MLALAMSSSVRRPVPEPSAVTAVNAVHPRFDRLCILVRGVWHSRMDNARGAGSKARLKTGEDKLLSI